MGYPEDKVNLLDDDDQETPPPPPPTVVDENEYEDDHYQVCRLLLVCLAYALVLGVFLSFGYHSSTTSNENAYGYEKGLFIRQYWFFSFSFWSRLTGTM